jgi:hypothetical protein
MTAPLELSEKVKRVWSGIDAPSIDEMKYMAWSSGNEAARAFIGVKPVDVDISSWEFDAAVPLFDLPARAAAAYLGPYIISMLNGIDLQEEVGFATDIATRSHTLAVMTSPDFWTDIAGPNLPPDCLEIIGEVADLMITKRGLLLLEDAEVATLQRLIRSINRKLGK